MLCETLFLYCVCVCVQTCVRFLLTFIYETQTDGERELFSVELLHNACSGQDWAEPKVVSGNAAQVSRMVAGTQLLDHCYYLPECVWQEAGIRI